MGKIIITQNTDLYNALYNNMSADDLSNEKKKLLSVLVALSRDMEKACDKFVKYRQENERTKTVVEVLISEIENVERRS